MKYLKHAIAAMMLLVFTCQISFAQQTEFSDGEIDRILSPIAIYPDIVLTHVLIASTYPLEVIEADRWVKRNKSYGGQAAVDGVSHLDWDPSVKALVAFPDLLHRMSDDLEWLQDLGEAFLASEQQVLERVQVLRKKAYAKGSLEDMQHLKVIRETETIYVEPAEDRVVYLPYYDPLIVYGDWHWNQYPPTIWRPSGILGFTSIHWGRKFVLSTGFYFGAISWPNYTTVLVHQHNRPQNYRARTIIHHPYTKRWSHNPHHRRNAEYRRGDRRKHSLKDGSNRHWKHSKQTRKLSKQRDHANTPSERIHRFENASLDKVRDLESRIKEKAERTNSYDHSPAATNPQPINTPALPKHYQHSVPTRESRKSRRVVPELKPANRETRSRRHPSSSPRIGPGSSNRSTRTRRIER